MKGTVQLRALNPTTSFLTATALAYAIGAGITAAAGTRLALQLILIDGFKYRPLHFPHTVGKQKCYFSSLPHQCWYWAICAPAADLSRVSRFSGSLSGIEPWFSVTRERHGYPLHNHRKLIGQKFVWSRAAERALLVISPESSISTVRKDDGLYIGETQTSTTNKV